ncbi:hypothetical protein LT493_36200 [Streptomyces tricolor]|nr:hypothetical protein [Streptomyces tricolor]
MEWEDLMVDGDPPARDARRADRLRLRASVQLLAAATAEAPGAAKLVPGPRTAAAFDLPLRLLTTTARSTFLGAAQDLTDLLGPRAAPDDDAGYATDPEPVTDDTVTELPPLEAGFYLYEDIALGALAVLGPLPGRPRTDRHRATRIAHDARPRPRRSMSGPVPKPATGGSAHADTPILRRDTHGHADTGPRPTGIREQAVHPPAGHRRGRAGRGAGPPQLRHPQHRPRPGEPRRRHHHPQGAHRLRVHRLAVLGLPRRQHAPGEGQPGDHPGHAR